MRKFVLSTLAATAFAISVLAQAPQGFKYQAVIRDAAGNILNNQAVGMQMTIQQGSIGGTTIYQETFSGTTSAYGLMNLEIGSGIVISGDFTTIDWSNGPYFIETAVDVAGGTSYSVMGTSQLMSVPYALHANTAENVVNDAVDDADNDPTNEIETWATLNGIPNMILSMQNGEQYVGASGGLELVIVSVTFPTAFNAVPRVLCTANTEVGTIYDDSFNVTIRQVTTTGFEMIVNRVDGSIWGQNLSVNWMAFEP